MPVLRRTLLGLRWQIVGYGVGLAMYAAVIVAIYPGMKETIAGLQLPEAFRQLYGPAASNLASFRNFITVELYQWMPLILSIYAIVAATGTIAGEEGRGALEILLAQPWSRGRIFLEKAAGLALGAIAVTLIASAGFLVSVPFVDIGGQAGLLELIGAMFESLPLVLLVASLALLLSTVAPSRATAGAIAAAVVVVSWLANGLADLTPQTAWLKYLSGFYYADVQHALLDGPAPWHLALVCAITALQIVVAILAFERREIGVARWQLGMFARRR